MLKIKKTIKQYSKRILLYGFLAAGFALSSCTDDLLLDGGDITMNEDGTFGPFDLEIPIHFDKGDDKTRATFGNDVKLNNVWIGLFDTKSGIILAHNDTTFADPNDFSGNHNTLGNEGNITVKLHSILFNNNTTDAYLIAVANSEGIMARDTLGNYMRLDTALFYVKNIQGLKNICVDTGSAEQILQEGEINAPLMSGLWGTQHGNYTVNVGGTVYSDKVESGPDRDHTSITLFDPATLKVNAQKRIKEGLVHLRRLYSQINVEVNFSDKFTSVSNPRIQLYNMPQYTFLQEHKTVDDSYKYDNQGWIKYTHNADYLISPSNPSPYPSAPFSEFTDRNTEPITVGSTINQYGKNRPAVVMDDVVKFENNKLTFSYWHYESKHWGDPNIVKSLNDRERMYEGTSLFQSLCPSRNNDFNNDAPYFLVSADVEVDGYKGRADFIIHEGYCCNPNGTQIAVNDNSPETEAKRALDFSTFRNTKYNYTININGLNSFKMKVESEDLSGDFNHGVGGELWSSDETKYLAKKMPKTGGTYKLTIPGTNSGIEGFYWAISDDNEANFWGNRINASDNMAIERFPYFNNLTLDGTSKTDSKFYQGITITYNGSVTDLNNLSLAAEDKEASISFNGQSEFNGALYLCGIYTSPDGMAKYYTVFKLTQNGLELAQPQLEMANAPATGNVIMGLNDHTVYWDPVEGAESYTISLVGKAFTITLKPGETYNTGDSNNFTMTLNEEPNGKLSFLVRYAASQGGMMSLFSDPNSYSTAEATIRVVANKGNNHSDPGEITRTIATPVWDFNTKDWQNAVGKLTVVTNGLDKNQEATVNGLTMFTGNSDKMTYLLYTQSNNYGFRPNGQAGLSNNDTEVNGRAFKFRQFANGKINVWTSAHSGNASTGRYIVTASLGTDGKLIPTTHTNYNANGSNVGVRPANGSPNLPIDVMVPNATRPNTYIYNSADIIFYKIVFTPQDR